MTRSRRPSVWVALLRCTSCRFTAIYFIPFWGAMVEGGLDSAAWAAFGALVWFAHSTGTEAVNRLSDRTEDEINRPERTALCEQVGFGRLRTIALAAWAVVGALDLGALAVSRSLTLAILLVLGVAAALGYSYGLRLGRKHYIALLVLTFPFSGTFMIGWALSHPAPTWSVFETLVVRGFPLFIVGLPSIATLAGIKDLTDIAGDVVAGYRSAWVRFLRSHSRAVVLAVVSAPYLPLLLLELAGAAPARYWLVFALYPAVPILMRCFTRARIQRERMATRELFYLYWLALECVTMWCYAPRAQTAIAAGAAFTWWLLATRYLHWHPGITRASVATLGDLLRPARSPALSTIAKP